MSLTTLYGQNSTTHQTAEIENTRALFASLISHQTAVLFLTEQTSHPQPDSSTLISKQTSTSQPNRASTVGW
jgi:hypothetical protein